ncbi:MAG: hypothetical protein M0035_12625 [Actinomycetota bacterium]|nr:hypothetical protein [Actinomycetota bacterium]
MDIEEFYEADERRRRSEEVELGRDWHDADGSRYELSWVADTGELYVMLEPAARITEDPFGDAFGSRVRAGQLAVAVVGWIADRERLLEVLDGWQEEMPKPNSVSWITERLRSHQVRRSAAAPG